MCGWVRKEAAEREREGGEEHVRSFKECLTGDFRLQRERKGLEISGDFFFPKRLIKQVPSVIFKDENYHPKNIHEKEQMNKCKQKIPKPA